MKNLLIITADGEQILKSQEEMPTLEQVQKLVGGNVEAVRIPEKFGFEMYVNEEGLLEGLDLNIDASVIAGQQIVGDVVIFENFKWE